MYCPFPCMGVLRKRLYVIRLPCLPPGVPGNWQERRDRSGRARAPPETPPAARACPGPSPVSGGVCLPSSCAPPHALPPQRRAGTEATASPGANGTAPGPCRPPRPPPTRPVAPGTFPTNRCCRGRGPRRGCPGWGWGACWGRFCLAALRRSQPRASRRFRLLPRGFTGQRGGPCARLPPAGRRQLTPEPAPGSRLPPRALSPRAAPSTPSCRPSSGSGPWPRRPLRGTPHSTLCRPAFSLGEGGAQSQLHIRGSTGSWGAGVGTHLSRLSSRPAGAGLLTAHPDTWSQGGRETLFPEEAFPPEEPQDGGRLPPLAPLTLTSP